MGDYVITVNSTVDLPKEWLEERKTHNSNRRKLVRMGMDET